MGLQRAWHRVAACVAWGCSLCGMGWQPVWHGVAACVWHRVAACVWHRSSSSGSAPRVKRFAAQPARPRLTLRGRHGAAPPVKSAFEMETPRVDGVTAAKASGRSRPCARSVVRHALMWSARAVTGCISAWCTMETNTNWSLVCSPVSRLASIASRHAWMKASDPLVARKKTTPVFRSARRPQPRPKGHRSHRPSPSKASSSSSVDTSTSAIASSAASGSGGRDGAPR